MINVGQTGNERPYMVNVMSGDHGRAMELSCDPDVESCNQGRISCW